MKTLAARILLASFVLLFAVGARAQDAASVTGTVTDSSGAVIPGAEVKVSSPERGLDRSTTTNSEGEYSVGGLPAGLYQVTISAKGFKVFEAKDLVLRVAQKARLDAALEVGQEVTKVIVEGTSVAQVDTQSSELAGTVTGQQITQLQLNGRNFVQLATLIPGVSNQTGQDEGTVGVYGNVAFSFNGGRTEYNNWEIDGGDNMDNGSNATLNVYPSLEAIAEVKVLTSNYGAQYGRNASGTVEVQTKSGTNEFHGNVYYFGRNDFFNARNFFDPAGPVPKFKKHDWGYTIGGPVFIPDHYNTDKKKTFFFFSEEWRRDLVPGQTFLIAVPSMAERSGNFSDLCPDPNGTFDDCPNVPNPAAVPIDLNAQPLLAMIPEPNAPGSACGGIACFNASPATPTRWREELVRVDHNFTEKLRATFRYIHDSWETVTPVTLWGPDSFPTIQTNFVGPGTSTVVRLTAEVSPTLLNEFVASYTGDHIFLTNQGPGAIPRPSSMTMTGIFPDFGGKLPDITVGGNAAYGDGFTVGQAYIPWNNANPTYTLRDNVSKLWRKHNLQFGAYLVIAQKNEQSSFGSIQGALNFDASNSVVGSGNAFADLLLGNIDSFSQANLAPKYYFRYQILEPYFQDDWRITPRLTLNLGLRVSLFWPYTEKFKQAFNWTPAVFDLANAPDIGPDGQLIDPATGEDLAIDDPRVFNGILQCGASGVKRGCVEGQLFNPAPRIGFAWDPWGTGKTAIRGGYGIFFEHGNGNEANVESLEATPPLVLNPEQPNIPGYTSIGSGGAGGAIRAFPLGFNAIETRGVWPYVQQWNLNVQHEFPWHFVSSIAYVGSKGTHLGQGRDLNQVAPLSLSQNPYQPGQPITPEITDANGNIIYAGDCATETTGPGGTAITGQALINLGIACGNDANPERPFVGFGSIAFLQYAANSTYHSLQVAVNRNIAPLTLSVAYTYSHSIDNSSDRFDTSFVDAFDIRRARASSNFDQRHMLNVSYVYDLPFFRNASGRTRNLLGGWQFAGIMSIQTGTPFNVAYSTFGDNAGVSNGAGPDPATFADLVGDPHASPCGDPNAATGPLLYDPCAFAAPRGLTFGNAGRNILRIPRNTNFDMSLLKKFKISETTGFEFRMEGFNIFNHTQWNGVNNDQASGDFLHPSGARRARTFQFGLKFHF